jgi:hypothetical protein
MKEMIIAVVAVLGLTGCPDTDVGTGEGGSGGGEDGSTVASSTSSGRAVHGCHGTTGSTTASSTASSGTGGMNKCQHLADTCTPDSACYTFKQCYEGVQDDPEAIAACEAQNPDGSVEWAALVQCGCADDMFPDYFCNGTTV